MATPPMFRLLDWRALLFVAIPGQTSYATFITGAIMESVIAATLGATCTSMHGRVTATPPMFGQVN